jgi:hypothetical protein
MISNSPVLAGKMVKFMTRNQEKPMIAFSNPRKIIKYLKSVDI